MTDDQIARELIAAAKLLTADNWDRATRVFDKKVDAMMASELKTLRRTMIPKVEKLLEEVSYASGRDLTDGKSAAEDIVNSLIGQGKDWSSSWDADNFWTNSFYHFEEE